MCLLHTFNRGLLEVGSCRVLMAPLFHILPGERENGLRLWAHRAMTISFQESP